MTTRSARKSDDAVFSATGKRWSEWYAILDGEGAAGMKHPQIAQLVQERYGTSGWWAQSITVEYERERGLRDVHQTPRGYEVSVSKTLSASAESLFAVWADDGRRLEWLGVGMRVRKANPNSGLRLDTGSVGSDLAVGLYPKGDARCQVVVQQIKLPDQAAVESRRAFWKDALERLEGMASRREPVGG